MIEDLLMALWFMLPAAIANVAPIFSSRIPLFKNWNTPMDFGAEFRGKPMLGPHKTWRGLLIGIVMATVVLWLQQLSVENFAWTNVFTGEVDYTALPVLILGPLFGLGALGGDAIKSFFKRRCGVQPGASWMPFDQLDYIIGAVLVSLPFVILSIRQYMLIFVLWFLVHIASTFIGWKLGLKDQPI